MRIPEMRGYINTTTAEFCAFAADNVTFNRTNSELVTKLWQLSAEAMSMDFIINEPKTKYMECATTRRTGDNWTVGKRLTIEYMLYLSETTSKRNKQCNQNINARILSGTK